jgi:hypothetical protein
MLKALRQTETLLQRLHRRFTSDVPQRTQPLLLSAKDTAQPTMKPQQGKSLVHQLSRFKAQQFLQQLLLTPTLLQSWRVVGAI